MIQSTLYAIILTDKAGIEFIRFGATTNFELRKAQHLRGLKTGFYCAHGVRTDYRFFHSSGKLRSLSRRERNKFLAKTAIRNKIIQRAREGEFKIEARALYSSQPEVIGLMERVLIHSFLHTSRLLNHYNDFGGVVAGVDYHRPSSSAIKHEVRKHCIDIINQFDITPEVRTRAITYIDSWCLRSECFDIKGRYQKDLAKENLKACKKNKFINYLSLAVRLGKQAEPAKPATSAVATVAERVGDTSAETRLSYPKLQALQEQMYALEARIKYYREQANMHHEDYLDLGGEVRLIELMNSGQDNDLLEDLQERKADRDKLNQKADNLQSHLDTLG